MLNGKYSLSEDAIWRLWYWSFQKYFVFHKIRSLSITSMTPFLFSLVSQNITLFPSLFSSLNSFSLPFTSLTFFHTPPSSSSSDWPVYCILTSVAYHVLSTKTFIWQRRYRLDYQIYTVVPNATFPTNIKASTNQIWHILANNCNFS